jgi:hypothetical protein
VSPGAWTCGRREEDSEGGETEAALALLGGLAPVEYADGALGVFGCEVAVGVGVVCERRVVRDLLREGWFVAHAHDVPFYLVQTAGQGAEFNAIELYIYACCVSLETAFEVRCAEMEYRRLL